MRPFTVSVRQIRTAVLIASLAIVWPSVPADAQAPRTAPTQKPKTATTRKPAPAKPTQPAGLQPAPQAQPPPPPQDVRFKTRYTTGDQVTESVTYLRGERERFELADMVLLKQRDQKRTVQISRAANTYLVVPDGAPATPAPLVDPNAPQKPAGVVTFATTIVDTGERKTAFGLDARHVKTTIDKQPSSGACDQSKQRIETDGWYVDMPMALAGAQQGDGSLSATTGCKDEIKVAQNGESKALGFPISYTTTFIGDDQKPQVVAMEVTEFEVTTLDAALFEIPEGLGMSMNVRELSIAVSNANEAKLAVPGPMPGIVIDKKPGALRVAVPEVINKTGQAVDTRALRMQMIAELTAVGVDAVPLAAAPQAELELRAAERGADYLLIAEVTELKASKAGGFTKMLKATAGDVTAGGDITEAKISVQLVAPGGKARPSTTTKGKDGGVGLKTGLGVARFAGSMYMNMYLGMYRSPMGALNTMRLMDMGGMGMLGNPALMRIPTSLGATKMGMGLDPTAGAATFLMQQAMMGSVGGSIPAGQQGPSFDASLGKALEGAAKDVAETLKKSEVAKKRQE